MFEVNLREHAFFRFVTRFQPIVGAVIRTKRDALEFFFQSRRFQVDEEKRKWIEYYHNAQLNCVFVYDKETKEIITTFVPTDLIKYKNALLKRVA